MINGIQIKICGLTSLADAEMAFGKGADYLGFILYPDSPRYVPPAAAKEIIARLAPRKKVAVCVQPTPEDLAAYKTAGFDFFQVHYPVAEGADRIPDWSKVVGPEKLWLAPKLSPGTKLVSAHFGYADAVLWDAYKEDGFGGTGQPSDWEVFRRYRKEYPEKKWILAGGLNPDNIAAAVRATGTCFVDCNSGVESAPGVKDAGKLQRLFAALHEATRHTNSPLRL